MKGDPRDLRAYLDAGPIHFMGIGGAGMCALAEAVLRGGGRVTGCDARPGPSVGALERMGVRVHTGHDPGHLDGAGALVVSAAVAADPPEIARARAEEIPVLKRAEALGGWVNAGRVLGVSGTHGKTTTTALLTGMLAEAGADPTGFVGGEVLGWQSHLRAGTGALFVVEADEYDRSFLHLRPEVAVVTNVEADHLDVYGSLNGVEAGFGAYLAGVRKGGTVVACADDPGAGRVIQGELPVGVTLVTYGLSAGATVRGEDLRYRDGVAHLRVRERGVDRGRLQVGLPGVHNVRNALGAAAAARVIGVEWGTIHRALEGFDGVRRRFQIAGEVRGVRVVDDYAHHPTEVTATLEAARTGHPGRRIVAVFQPHLYTRTRDLGREFGKALAAADEVWVTEVYPAREPPIPGVDGKYLAGLVEAEGAPAGGVHLHAELDTLPAALAGALRPGDLCLLMGAGSIERVPRLLLTALHGSGAETEVSHA
ncbi:MAG: UDP-N-acetylmuramate--L-alanine ligase [Gemmatimonadota bacterium]